MHSHCPINCLGPATIQHILHPEPAQKKLHKWRFSAFSFLSQGLSRFLVCSSKLFIALHRNHCPARQLADVARGGQDSHNQGGIKKLIFRPNSTPGLQFHSSPNKFYTPGFLWVSSRGVEHTLLSSRLPACSASLPIRVTERELFSTSRLFTLSGLFA